MHTFNGSKARIHFNSDMNGDCEIIEKESGTSIKIPCEDILDFVADYVRSQRIGMLEQMSTENILDLK